MNQINIAWVGIIFISWILEPLTSSKLNHAQSRRKFIYLYAKALTQTHTNVNTFMCTRIYHNPKRIFQQVVNTWSKIWYSIDTRKLVMSTTQKTASFFNDFRYINEEDAILQLKQTSGQTWIIWPHHIQLDNVLWCKYNSNYFILF